MGETLFTEVKFAGAAADLERLEDCEMGHSKRRGFENDKHQFIGSAGLYKSQKMTTVLFV